MKNPTYSLDDLLQLTKLGRFGNDEMNRLAAQAFLYAKRLERENKSLKKSIEESGITFFSVGTQDQEKPSESSK
jgi:hypothetical protein